MSKIIRVKDFKNKSAISASRIDSFLECTMKYGFRYLLKCPDTSNDGANRGSVCHDIFEVLSDNKYKNRVKEIIEEKTVRKDKPLWKLVCSYAKKYNVNDDENLNTIDEFIVNGLKSEFYGPSNTVEVYTEKEFDFEYEDTSAGINYRCKGFIDKIFVLKDESTNTLYLECKDFKSSKVKFDKEKIENNNQTIIYQLALKRFLFPELELRNFSFIFLKFPQKPIQVANLLSDVQLQGYEHWLTDIQKRINNFSEKNLESNFAANNETLKMTRCGKEGFKKDGSPYFICQAQLPMDYYVLLNSKKEVVKSSHKLDLEIGEGESVEKRRYTGCRYFFDKNENRIRV